LAFRTGSCAASLGPPARNQRLARYAAGRPSRLPAMATALSPCATCGHVDWVAQMPPSDEQRLSSPAGRARSPPWESDTANRSSLGQAGECRNSRKARVRLNVARFYNSLSIACRLGDSRRRRGADAELQPQEDRRAHWLRPAPRPRCRICSWRCIARNGSVGPRARRRRALSYCVPTCRRCSAGPVRGCTGGRLPRRPER